jgi:hypothetical protein
MLSHDSNIINGYVASDARVERMRHTNRMHALKAEQEAREQEAKQREEAARRERASRREDALTAALLEKQAEELRATKLRQFVSETAPELRDLKAKLAAAYAAKERKAQMDEKVTIKEQVRAEERQWADAAADDLRKMEEARARRRAEQLDSCNKQAAEMREHMALRGAAQQEAEQHYKRERAEVDAIVTKIQEEDYLEQLARAQKQLQVQQEHETFMEQRQRVLQDEKDRQAAENEEVRRFLQEQLRRKESNERVRREKEAQKQRILEEQSKAIEFDRKKKEEMELLVNDLYVEQEAAKQRAAEIAERERKVRDRQTMIAANEEQMRQKKLRQEQRHAEEQVFRRQMLERYAEEDRIDRMTAQRRQQAKLEHARRVQELIEQRRQLEAEDLAREQAIEEAARLRQAEHDKMVAEERERLLREHAPNLTGFLPRKIASNESDARVVNNAKTAEPNRRAEAMARHSRY